MITTSILGILGSASFSLASDHGRHARHGGTHARPQRYFSDTGHGGGFGGAPPPWVDHKS